MVILRGAIDLNYARQIGLSGIGIDIADKPLWAMWLIQTTRFNVVPSMEQKAENPIEAPSTKGGRLRNSQAVASRFHQIIARTALNWETNGQIRRSKDHA
jgi:Tfp pilus assembly PilM family ATPase